MNPSLQVLLLKIFPFFVSCKKCKKDRRTTLEAALGLWRQRVVTGHGPSDKKAVTLSLYNAPALSHSLISCLRTFLYTADSFNRIFTLPPPLRICLVLSRRHYVTVSIKPISFQLMFRSLYHKTIIVEKIPHTAMMCGAS